MDTNEKRFSGDVILEDSYPQDRTMFDDIEADYNGIVDSNHHRRNNDYRTATADQLMGGMMQQSQSFRLMDDSVAANADDFDIGRQQQQLNRFNSIELNGNDAVLAHVHHQQANDYFKMASDNVHQNQLSSMDNHEINHFNNFDVRRESNMKDEDTIDTQYSAIQQRISFGNVAPKLSPQLQAKDFQNTDLVFKKQSSEEQLAKLSNDQECSMNNQQRVVVEAESTAEAYLNHNPASSNSQASNNNDDSSTNQDDTTHSNEAYQLPEAYTGDGRKKEAKMVKNGRVTDFDEFALDKQIRDYQTTNPKILELERTLDELKNGKPGKQGVQALRNKITAQLSRDRMKMEVEFLREQCSRYQRLLRLMSEKANNRDFCESCHDQVETILDEHENKGVLINNATTRVNQNVGIKRQKVNDSKEKKLNGAKQSNKKAKQELIKQGNASSTQDSDASTPRSSSGNVMILGKRSRAAAGALFCVAGMLGIVYDQTDNQYNSASQSLVEVKSEDRMLIQMDDAQPIQPKCSCPMHTTTPLELDGATASNSKALKQVYGQPQAQCSDNYFSLDDAYMTYDVRESYLNREPFEDYASTNDPLYQQTMDWETITTNIWNPGSTEIVPASGNSQQQECDYSTNKWASSLAKLGEHTSTIFCPNANMLVPFQSSTDENVDKADVTLESDSDGNAYLHLILPADKINFLNNGNSSNYTFYNQTGGFNNIYGEDQPFPEEDYDQILIEVGCKVYEVNRIMYKSNPVDPAPII